MKKLFILGFILSNSFLLIAGCVNSSKDQENASSVDAGKIIKDLEKGRDIYYKDASINGDLDFTKLKGKTVESSDNYRVYVNGGITFVNCTFNGKITGYTVNDKKAKNLLCFTKNAVFLNCSFKDEVLLNEAVFEGIVNFSQSIFDKKASFEGAYLKFKDNYFSSVFFKDEARFHRMVVLGNLNFMRATFEGITYFQNVVFHGIAQFSATNFKKYTEFTSVTAMRDISFNQAIFKDKAIFNNSVFHEKALFNNVVFAGVTSFNKLVFLGAVQMNEMVAQKELSIKESRFCFGLPETDKIKIEDTEALILSGSTHSSGIEILKTEIIK